MSTLLVGIENHKNLSIQIRSKHSQVKTQLVLVVFLLVNLYFLLVYIEHSGDESPKILSIFGVWLRFEKDASRIRVRSVTACTNMLSEMMMSQSAKSVYNSEHWGVTGIFLFLAYSIFNIAQCGSRVIDFCFVFGSSWVQTLVPENDLRFSSWFQSILPGKCQCITSLEAIQCPPHPFLFFLTNSLSIDSLYSELLAASFNMKSK
jgi:hypothetical protein